MKKVRCSTCGGTKKVIGIPCIDCNGSGISLTEEENDTKNPKEEPKQGEEKPFRKH